MGASLRAAMNFSLKFSMGMPRTKAAPSAAAGWKPSMPPGSTVHDLKEKIMQWLEEISKEYGWNPPERGGCCSRAREGGLDPDQCNR